MSTRRAVRPDANVYRQTRRLTRRKRNYAIPAIAISLMAIVIMLLVLWIRHRH